jgi:opacity protein-like surface antigen
MKMAHVATDVTPYLNYRVTKMKLILSSKLLFTRFTLYSGIVLFGLVSSLDVQAQEKPDHMPVDLVVTSNFQLPTTGNREEIALNNNNAQTTNKKNNINIGVAAQFINGISIGVQGKVAVFDKFSLRPEFFWNREDKSGTTVTGVSYGLAATYDLNFDNQGKTSAYFGPKVSINSGSGRVSVSNRITQSTPPSASLLPFIQVPGYASATRFGLVAGVDQEITDNFTIGANINFLPLGFGSSYATNPYSGDRTNNVIAPTSSYVDVGIHASYSF